jgi:hypothetical protein
VTARCRNHRHQAVDGYFLQASAQDVIQPGAGYSELFARFGLIPGFFLHEAPNLRNELSAHFHVFGVGDAHVVEQVAAWNVLARSFDNSPQLCEQFVEECLTYYEAEQSFFYWRHCLTPNLLAARPFNLSTSRW